MNLDLIHIECEIVCEASGQLAAALYKAVRGFETHFKASCCPVSLRSCTSCADGLECPYHAVFAQQLSADPGIVRLHQKPSVPFSLSLASGECASACRIRMVVIGSAINYVDVFLAALTRMVEECISNLLLSSPSLFRYYSLDYQGVRHEISPQSSLSDTVILLSGQHILHNTVHADQVRLRLLSPLRLVCNGSIARNFDFALFFRSQMRRCSSLWAHYGSGELALDFAELSLAAQNVTILEDDIRSTQLPLTPRNRGGLTGCAECVGLVEPMFALLFLGSYVNAGKGAAFGSGFHTIEVL